MHEGSGILNIEELIAKGYSEEFIEWYFSCQTKGEERTAIKSREKQKRYRTKHKDEIRVIQGRYRRNLKFSNPVQYEKHRQQMKDRYYKLKSDPVKYAEYRKSLREYTRRRQNRIRNDPATHMENLEKRRIKYREQKGEKEN